MKTKSLFLVLILFMISSCTYTYDYEIPADPAVRECIWTKCAIARRNCNEKCDIISQRCETLDYSDDTAGSRCGIVNSPNCKKDCTTSYNECFTNCGGSFEAILVR